MVTRWARTRIADARAHHPDVLVRLALSIGAAGWFVAGCMFMKPAAGMTRLGPTLAVFGCFAVGLVLDTILVRLGNDVGVAYTMVIGLEVVIAVVVASLLYDERVSGQRLVAVGLVVVGVVLLAVEHVPVATEPTGASLRRSSAVQPRAQLGTAGDAELAVDALEMGVDRAA
jgi:multidrug transporter EmrE-like cation transporter